MGAPQDGATSTEKHVHSKKRLSRKEQKARKRQKKAHDAAKQHSSLDEAKESKEQQTSTSSSVNSNPIDYNDTYKPVEIPPHSSKAGKSLGKWFPSATVIKSKCEPPKPKNDERKAALLLFYHYVEPNWPESKVDHLISFLGAIAKVRVLGGRIRVAPEGLNVTLSSLDDEPTKSSALETLHHFAQDLQQFDSSFKETHFKYIPDLAADRHFPSLKVLPVKELVFYGLDQKEAPLKKSGVHLEPEDFHQMLATSGKETVVIDVRNHYEAVIGRFDGQETKEGAKYIDPKMRKSTDFKNWLEKPETQEELSGKNVVSSLRLFYID